MRLFILHTVGAAALVAAPITSAHHSRSVYDLESEIIIQGTVSQYEWINPHVYIYVESESDAGESVVWEIEASPPSLMSRRGWTRETLTVGDIVAVMANPAKDRDRTMALGVTLEQPGGTVLDMLESASFADGGMVFPDVKQIEIDGDVVRIRSEFEAVERVVRMDLSSDGEGTPALHGHLVGRWEDGALILETSRFLAHRMGNAFSLPSGPGKQLIERFELDTDGTSLTYGFELTDPDYLKAPISGEVQWVYRPDLEPGTVECDLENARRYLAD
jgi:hypothetical protein